MLRWLISQPESHLSAKWAQMDALNIPTTFLRPEIGLNPVHEPLIRRDLTSHLDYICGELWGEVGLALQELWGKETEVWRQVNLDYTIRRVVARAANRVFVGDELCMFHFPLTMHLMLTCKLAVITTTLKARFAMLLGYPPTVF